MGVVKTLSWKSLRLPFHNTHLRGDRSAANVGLVHIQCIITKAKFPTRIISRVWHTAGDRYIVMERQSKGCTTHDNKKTDSLKYCWFWMVTQPISSWDSKIVEHCHTTIGYLWIYPYTKPNFCSPELSETSRFLHQCLLLLTIIGSRDYGGNRNHVTKAPRRYGEARVLHPCSTLVWFP